jgi:hypothetical protein
VLPRRDAHRRAGCPDRAFARHLDLDQEPPQHRERLLCIRLGEQQPELCLSDPSHQLVGGCRACETIGHGPQQLVACLKPCRSSSSAKSSIDITASDSGR